MPARVIGLSINTEPISLLPDYFICTEVSRKNLLFIKLKINASGNVM